MKYLLVEWPESQYFMEYIGIAYPKTCYWAQDSQDIFVPEYLYEEINASLCDK